MKVQNLKWLVGAALVAASLGVTAAQERTTMVGGESMFPSKNIIANAMNSKDHMTLVAAVKAAGLVDTLQSPGPFTVFAPVNKAFDKLPKGTVSTLLKPENKDKLTGILTYHVVAGRLSAEEIAMKAKEMGGKLELKTVAGGKLWLQADKKGGWWVIDEKGDKARITIADVFQSNGVIHVIDTVMLPN